MRIASVMINIVYIARENERVQHAESLKTRGELEMYITREILALLVTFLFLFFTPAAGGYAATIYATSPSYADVNSAISSANSGDTVIVPAGAATWNSRLTITKGVNLIGTGVGQTNITNSYNCTSTAIENPLTYFIVYQPENYSLNTPFRISGITFDFGGGCSGIATISSATAGIQTKVRIDHNSFTNCRGSAFNSFGSRGVVDNNTFACPYPVRNIGNNAGQTFWNNVPAITWSVPHPADDNIYYEDNTFTGVRAGCGTAAWMDSGWGSRYVVRYNTVTVACNMYPLLDLHGNQPSSVYASFGGEVYGNQINAAGYEIRLMDQRGGKLMIFYNNDTSSSSAFEIQTREEYDDSISPTTNPSPQHVNDSYYWNNRRNLTGSLYTVTEGKLGNIPLRDRDYFTQTTWVSDGSSGVGCGTLAARPTTCITGVGYWATDQSCTDLTGMVGTNPVMPISGTLYKCTATNTWRAYYTPYKYPHPLRVDARDGSPTPPQNLRIAN